MIVEQQCEYCHTVFTRERKPGGREARFCSDRCRVAANRNRNRTAPTGEDVTFARTVEIVPIGQNGIVTFASSNEPVTFALSAEDVTITEPVTIASPDSGVFTDKWSKVQFRLDIEYEEISPEWLALQRLKMYGQEAIA